MKYYSKSIREVVYTRFLVKYDDFLEKANRNNYQIISVVNISDDKYYKLLITFGVED